MLSTFVTRLMVDVRRERSRIALRPAPPWPADELGDERAALRINSSVADFWASRLRQPCAGAA